jgi:hypothetical protein
LALEGWVMAEEEERRIVVVVNAGGRPATVDSSSF